MGYIMTVEKLMSKRGQVSMEIGIIVAAAVAVATVAAYFYLKGIKDSSGRIESTIGEIEGPISRGTENYINEIDKVLRDDAGGSGEGDSGGGGSGDDHGIPKPPEGGWPA